MIEHLDQFIADLEHERGLIDVKLEAARTFRASLDGEAPVATVTPVQVAA